MTTENELLANIDKLTTEAEKRCATILAELEKATGTLVQSVTIVDIDVSNIHDTRQQIQRRVNIELKLIPGTRWSK